MKTPISTLTLKLSILHRSINSALIRLKKLLCLVVLFMFSSFVQAGDLDDVSIQIIGLDQAPKEALQEIPLPPPASVSITDMQGDVLFNRPMSPAGSLNPGSSDAITAPVAGGGSGGGSVGVGGGP